MAAVGIGGNLVDRKASEVSAFQRISRVARQYISLVQNARGKHEMVAEKGY